MRKITCPCDQVFSFDFPEIIDLDASPEVLNDIKNGSFLSCICPSCNTLLHTELQTRLVWPSKNTALVLIPEIDRYAFLSGHISIDETSQIVIGFAELSDRIVVLQNNLDPLAVEAIKYHLISKSRETGVNQKIQILFDHNTTDKILEFHIHGLQQDKMAVTKIPYSIYETLQKESQEHPDMEPYASLTHGSYISVNNLIIEDSQNA